MKKDHCALCRIYFGTNNPHRRKRLGGDVHDYCVLKYEKEKIYGSCRNFLRDVGGVDALSTFIFESTRVRSLPSFAELLSKALSQVWSDNPDKDSREQVTAFAAWMSKTLVTEVLIVQPRTVPSSS